MSFQTLLTAGSITGTHLHTDNGAVTYIVIILPMKDLDYLMAIHHCCHKSKIPFEQVLKT